MPEPAAYATGTALGKGVVAPTPHAEEVLRVLQSSPLTRSCLIQIRKAVACRPPDELDSAFGGLRCSKEAMEAALQIDFISPIVFLLVLRRRTSSKHVSPDYSFCQNSEDRRPYMRSENNSGT